MASQEFLDAKGYEPYLIFAKNLARQASEMMKAGQAKRFAAPSELDSKASTVDLVTEVDLAVEKLIKDAIKKEFPDHLFIGEETSADDGSIPKLTDAMTWIVDPIDGTTNFVHSFPPSACSIGFCHLRTPVVGVIIQPFLCDQMVYATRGGGAWVEGGRFGGVPVALPLGGRAQPMGGLSDCLVFASIGSTLRNTDEIDLKCRIAGNLMKRKEDGGAMVRGIRNTGATAPILCHIALGELDMYPDEQPKEWDVAAGTVIVSEAGGACYGSVESFERGTDHISTIMSGRKFVFVRPVAPTETETAAQIQHRVTADYYDIVKATMAG